MRRLEKLNNGNLNLVEFKLRALYKAYGSINREDQLIFLRNALISTTDEELEEMTQDIEAFSSSLK